MTKVILAVDDEPNILNTLERVLRPRGYRVIKAHSGAEALEILTREEIAVIISDQRMPTMSGSELLSQIYQRYPQTVRLILSGYADFHALHSAVNDGKIFQFIAKPWDDAHLLKCIEAAFRHYQVRQDEAASSKIVDFALEAIMITDQNGYIESVNQTFCLLTEYAENIVLGQKIQLFDKRFLDDDTLCAMEDALQNFGAWEGNVVVGKCSGGTFPAYLSITSIHDEENKPKKNFYSFIDNSKHAKTAHLLSFYQFHDSNTGLLNREAFIKQARTKLNAQHPACNSALMFIYFHELLNLIDEEEYAISDSIAQEISRRIRACNAAEFIIGRMAPHEFAVMMLPNNVAQNTLTDDTVMCLSRQFAQPIQILDKKYKLQPKIAYVRPQTADDDLNRLIQNARDTCRGGF